MFLLCAFVFLVIYLQHNWTSYGQVLMKFFRQCRQWHKEQMISFDGDPDDCLDPGIF